MTPFTSPGVLAMIAIPVITALALMAVRRWIEPRRRDNGDDAAPGHLRDLIAPDDPDNPKDIQR